VIVVSARNVQALRSKVGVSNFVRSARSGRGCEEGQRGVSSLEWQWVRIRVKIEECEKHEEGGEEGEEEGEGALGGGVKRVRRRAREIRRSECEACELRSMRRA